MVIYCVCLHLYAVSTVEATPPAPPPYEYAPSLFVSHMTRLAESCELEEWSDQQRPWVQLLAKYWQLLADYSQGEVLLKLGLGERQGARGIKIFAQKLIVPY